VLRLPQGDQRVELGAAGSVTIGRGETNAIVLPGDHVSREHAFIQSNGRGDFYITDLGSGNGTFVNDRRIIARALLRHNDRIRIGDIEMVFCLPAAPNPPATEGASATQKTTSVNVEMRLTSVLVTDLRDYTGIAQQVEPDALSRALAGFNRRASSILENYGAWSHKFLGDAVMGVWIHREPEQAPRDLFAILQAASELADLAATLSQQWKLPGPWRIGAGICTGFSAVGNIGSSRSADFTAIGEVVNRTFRIESATRQIGCDVAVAEETFHILNRVAPVCEYFVGCEANLKGYDEPRPLYGASFVRLKSLLDFISQGQ